MSERDIRDALASGQEFVAVPNHLHFADGSAMCILSCETAFMGRHAVEFDADLIEAPQAFAGGDPRVKRADWLKMCAQDIRMGDA